jgi:hypothetical protein
MRGRRLPPPTSIRRPRDLEVRTRYPDFPETVTLAEGRNSERRLSLARRGEKPVLRARQSQILAQCGAFILAAEQAAPLQLRHDAVDEVVEPTRQVGDMTFAKAQAFDMKRAVPLRSIYANC